jgi:hypothetical protein
MSYRRIIATHSDKFRQARFPCRREWCRQRHFKVSDRPPSPSFISPTPLQAGISECRFPFTQTRWVFFGPIIVIAHVIRFGLGSRKFLFISTHPNITYRWRPSSSLASRAYLNAPEANDQDDDHEPYNVASCALVRMYYCATRRCVYRCELAISGSGSSIQRSFQSKICVSSSKGETVR